MYGIGLLDHRHFNPPEQQYNLVRAKPFLRHHKVPFQVSFYQTAWHKKGQSGHSARDAGLFCLVPEVHAARHIRGTARHAGPQCLLPTKRWNATFSRNSELSLAKKRKRFRRQLTSMGRPMRRASERASKRRFSWVVWPAAGIPTPGPTGAEPGLTVLGGLPAKFSLSTHRV
jgi:hypothetical protein